MSMCSNYQSCVTIKKMTHGHFFTCYFSMKIHNKKIKVFF